MNNDWSKLKQSANQIPTNDSLLPYVLEVLKNGEEGTNHVIRTRVYDFLSIPEDIKNIKYPNYPDDDGILANRFSFSLSKLYKAGALVRPRRGIYQITEVGQRLLTQYGDQLTEKVLEEEPDYIRYMSELAERTERKSNALQEVNIDKADPEKVEIGKMVNQINNEIAIELLDKIRNSSPKFFEYLVVDLLVKMGYSGENGDAKITSYSNDNGIDGIINQDPLGTSTVYLQAKRYKEDNKVGRPAIQAFYGALAGVNADRGVFITTSDYSKEAKLYAKSQGIVLIDGIQLTDLMLKYQVGVEEAHQYTVFRIDNDYFELE
ncbi:restriction endonuclease [Vagococcus sp. BWB3-3]|uniref:Restriction endonuclease n=1 Tax=Vagococcus allomyrinae TaxID=2794353 RepID=A0A940PAI9_9ENTE|nr:restriction endonuclease [Vagococcus allomyrinae]MBP1040982.1 restriction endonuclease [Vagococcus allomyrinae]